MYLMCNQYIRITEFLSILIIYKIRLVIDHQKTMG